MSLLNYKLGWKFERFLRLDRLSDPCLGWTIPSVPLSQTSLFFGIKFRMQSVKTNQVTSYNFFPGFLCFRGKLVFKRKKRLLFAGFNSNPTDLYKNSNANPWDRYKISVSLSSSRYKIVIEFLTQPFRALNNQLTLVRHLWVGSLWRGVL